MQLSVIPRKDFLPAIIAFRSLDMGFQNDSGKIIYLSVFETIDAARDGAAPRVTGLGRGGKTENNSRKNKTNKIWKEIPL